MAAIIFNVLLLLDGAIYNLIDYLYDIFDFLAKINIFGADDYNAIVSRIYVILGLFMLFVLAYSLLKAVINPDDFAKGENSFPNLIKNVVISLAIIILLPTVFTVIFNIQNSILNNDTIPKLILGTDFDSEIDADAGRRMAYYTFTAFFHENETWCESNGYSTDDNTCADHIAGNGWLVLQNGPSLSSVRDSVMQGTSFTSFSQYGEAIDADQIDYMFLISTVAGIFILYVLLNFCFDLAIRVIKLAFYQIIAPIPVICRILPGGKMKDVFSKWTKQVISIFLEVFIRIGIMYLGIFLITLIIDNFGNIAGINSLPLRVIIFIRQAPKLLGELLNLDTGGMKLGLMDKLAMGGGLLAGAAAGGLVTGGTRNFVSAFKGKGIGKDFKSGNYGTAFKKIGGSIIPGVTSGIAGAGSAMVRSGYGAKGAKNLKDMAGAAHAGAAAAGAAKAKRAAYKASHRTVSIAGHNFDVGKIPLVGGAIGVGAGHASDLVHGAAQWAGIDNMQALIDDNKIIDDINARKKGVRSAAEDLIVGESNKAGVDKSFGIAGMSTKRLRELRQDMEAAKGTAGYAAAQDAYDSYLKSFVDGVQNQALLGTTNWDSLSVGDRADLGEVRIAAKNYRDILKANLAQRYVANSGFNSSILDESQSLDVGSGPMKDIGDQLKIAKTENSMKINELRQKQENSGK